jgi:hypothetical protein
MALTSEEEAALPQDAKDELFSLREAIGAAESARDAAVAQAAAQDLSWQNMQLSRNAAQDLRVQMQVARDLAVLLRDRWKKLADDIQATVDALPASPSLAQGRAAVTSIRQALTTARADIATILAGG